MGKAKLQLLAHQTPDHTWVKQETETAPLLFEVNDYSEGDFVLVKLSASGQVEQLQAIQISVLEFVEQQLPGGITSTDLQQEEQRAEQWRQSLTLQSQELGRRALEMEARRDQIQELEENLKQEKKQLELRAAELESSTQELERRSLEVETRWTQIQELEENLMREKQQLDLKAAELESKAAELPAHQSG